MTDLEKFALEVEKLRVELPVEKYHLHDALKKVIMNRDIAEKMLRSILVEQSKATDKIDSNNCKICIKLINSVIRQLNFMKQSINTLIKAGSITAPPNEGNDPLNTVGDNFETELEF